MCMIPEHYVKKALWIEYLQERELINSDSLWGVAVGSDLGREMYFSLYSYTYQSLVLFAVS